MPIFTYKVKDKDGNIIEDTIQSTNKNAAADNLKSQGYQVLTVRSSSKINNFMLGGISVSEKAAFCRFMATMIRSGMSIPEGIDIIEKETKNPKMKKVLSDLSFQTKKGKSVSAVLSEYKEDFDAVFLTMVRVGEESGTLEQSFDYLSKQMSASHELAEKIKGSMMYPAVIVVAMFGNGILMAVFVLPRLAQAFLKLDVPLPVYTRLLLNTGQFFGEHSALVILTALGIGVIFIILFMVKKTRSMMIKFVSNFPVVKRVVQHIDIARFSRTLSTLLKSGVPIVESLDVSAESITRPKLHSQAKNFGKEVAKGESLSSILTKNRNVFPAVMVQTIKAGEQSGTLEVVLEEVADFYEKEVEFSLKKLTSLIEPVLMLVIGIVVGFMVVIMIAPIYSIIGGLQSTIENN